MKDGILIKSMELKKKRVIVFFAAQGHFCSPLLKLHPLYDLQASFFYLESHPDQNSNIALLTNARKLTLFPGSISNFCSQSTVFCYSSLDRLTQNPHRTKYSELKETTSVH